MEPRTEKLTRAALLLVLIGVLLAYGFDTFRRTRGALVTATDRETYMVVSARPPAQDLEIIALADASERVEYLRHDAAFARALRRGLKISDAEWEANPIRVFSGPDRKMIRSETSSRALDSAMDAARTEGERGTSANLAVAAFVGIIAASLLRAGAKLFRATLLGLAGTSLYQVLTACPTCPMTTILGVPAGLLGFGLYGAAFALSLVPRATMVLSVAAGGLCAAAAGWQAMMQLSQGTACVPCTLISFGNLYVLSTIVMRRDVDLRVTRPLRLAWGVGGLMTLTVTAALGTANATTGTNSPGGLTLASVSKRPVLLGMPLKELGLPIDAKRPVLVVVAEGCHPCEMAKAFFGTYPMPGLRIVYLGSGPQGAEVTTRRDLIDATPTFLFFDQNGKVKEQRKGWMDDLAWQKKLLNDIESISAEQTTEKPSSRGHA